MHPKTTVSDAISNYYFQQQLPRTASQRTFHPSGKENVFIRNQNIAGKQLIPIYNSKIPLQEIKNNSPTNISYLTHFKSESRLRPIQKTSISKVPSYVCSVQKKELKQKRSDSAASHKKSVKFLQKIQDLQPVKSTLSHRSRSNSILKSRSTSKDLKNTYQVKPKLSSRIQIDHKNAAIKLRYRQILNQLGREVKLRVMSSIQNSTSIIVNKPIHSKYIDPSFPPLQTSISQASYLPRVSWKRISQISTLSSAIVRSKTNQTNMTTIKHQREQCYSFCLMMKMMRNAPKLLDFLFEDLKFTEKGAYIIKIFQQSQWKYMIIDDYVPVLEQNGSPKLAFIGIEFQNKPQIWPLLFHKAYAAYLGSYHKLHQIALSQLFKDLFRLPTQKFSLNETSINNVITTLSKQIDQEIMLYAERRQQYMQKGHIYDIINIQRNNQKITLFRQKDKNTHVEVSITDFTKQYKQLTVIHIPNFENFSSIDIPIYSNIGRQIKNKYLINFSNPPEITYEQFISRITLKSFNIEKLQRCTFIIKNYDRNLQTKTQNWCRVILLQKELDSYRWIVGKYSKDTISFMCSLQPGKYYLILIPDRKAQPNLHFSIISYTKDIPLSFKTEIEHNIASMIEKGCADLAQRTGKMTQINKWICTYSLVHAESGVIIENINNQRRNGNIRIFRTIKNLKTKNCILLPLNRQFYLPNNPKVRDEAELIIQKEESASIVLLFFGGLDFDFLKHFNFGL